MSGLVGAISSASGAEVFEELRFVWEYLAAAFLLLSVQSSPRAHAVARGAAVVTGFSLLSLLYFPFKEFAMARALPGAAYMGWYLLLAFSMTFSLLAVFRASVPDLLWLAAAAYVAQHIVYVVVHEMLALWLCPWLAQSMLAYPSVSVLACVIVYLAVYRLFSGPLRRAGGTLLERGLRGTVTSTIILAMLFSCTFGFQHLFQLEQNRPTAVWMDLLVCGMLLGIQYVSCLAIVSSRESLRAEGLLESAQAHWELSQALLGRLGSLFHDVWHIVIGLRARKVKGFDRYLERVESQLDDYQSTFYSGSDALNYALAGARVLCEARQINMSCSVGITEKGSLPSAELYALLDGVTRLCICAAESVEGDAGRALDLRLDTRAGLLMVSCDVTVAEGADPWADAPTLHSLTLLAERNGGTLQTSVGNGIATVRVTLPVSGR